MITCRKAQLDDLEKLSIAIIRMKNDDTTLTKSEIMECLDHMYYLYDTEYDTILAVIGGYRVIKTEDACDPTYSVMIGMRRYEIKYFVSDTDDESALVNLVREFLADMNDYPSIYRGDVDSIRRIALRSNNFVYNSTLKIYTRFPIANVSMIH